MNWLSKLGLIFKDRQLRKRVLFVFFILAVFRLLANIPIPGIDTENLRRFFAESEFFGLLNIFSGGAMTNLSIIMLGLGPFITSTIIMQLLTMIFPALERMYKEEGEEGKRKFNQWSRLLTIPLAVLQSYAMLSLLSRQGAIGALTGVQTITSIVTITAGSLLLMWLGELISEKGIGNGVSILIFAGIVASTPTEIRRILLDIDGNPEKIPTYLLFFALAILIIAAVVTITEARRNIPISYAKRVRGHKVYGGVSTYLPMNINPAGVIPIIFAIALMLFPSMIANFMSTSSNETLLSIANWINMTSQNPWFYGVAFFLLVFVFTYFYTMVTFDPKSISENLQKMGGFVPGIRPGKPTADFLHKVLYRILFMGATFLGLIAVLPSIIQGVTRIQSFSFLIGGTAILIVVSVVLELWRQVKSQLEMKEYENL